MTRARFRGGTAKRGWLAASSSVLTSLTITVAVVVVFSALGSSSLTHAFQTVPLPLAMAVGIATLAIPFLVAGGLWGLGMATLLDHARWPAARTGALSIAGMFMLLEAPVHLSQALPVPAWMPLDVHGAFTVVFAIEISLVAGVASTRLAQRVGMDRQPGTVGAKVGLAAAAGTVAGSVVALGLGFRVGHPPAVNMVWALYVVVAVGGLSGGWALGWLLATHVQPWGSDQPGANESSTLVDGRLVTVVRRMPRP